MNYTYSNPELIPILVQPVVQGWSRFGGQTRQALVDIRVKVWWTYASRFGGHTRQALVDIRVKHWWTCASSIGGWSGHGL